MEWPQVEPAAIVATAREYVGTPWHHDARLKGVGIDCVGLLACTLAELGVPVRDVHGYGMGDEFEVMRDAIAVHADLILEFGSPKPTLIYNGFALTAGATVLATLEPGDVLLYRNTDLPPNMRILNHCGIYNGVGGMIHAWNAGAIRAVAEHPLDDFWFRSIVAVYRYRGVTA